MKSRRPTVLQARWILGIVLFLCVFSVGRPGAQETVAADPAREKELRDFQGTLYPGFLSEDRETTASERIAEADVQTSDSLEAVASIRQQVLADDLASTVTWTNTRARLDPGMEEVRMLMLASANPEEVEAAAEKFLADLEAILAMAPYQAPGQETGLVIYRDRIRRQLTLILSDYRMHESAQLQSTDELLRLSMDEFHRLLFHSDLDRGSGSDGYRRVPDDWKVGDFTEPAFAEHIAGWSGSQLVAGYADRVEILTEALRRKKLSRNRDPIVAIEMGELARELARRTYEVPVTSQVPFRNTALRLDVLAENLYDYIKADNGPYARRQLRVMGKTAGEAQAFLALRDRGL